MSILYIGITGTTLNVALVLQLVPALYNPLVLPTTDVGVHRLEVSWDVILFKLS